MSARAPETAEVTDLARRLRATLAERPARRVSAVRVLAARLVEASYRLVLVPTQGHA